MSLSCGKHNFAAIMQSPKEMLEMEPRLAERGRQGPASPLGLECQLAT